MRSPALQILLIAVVLTPALYAHTGAGASNPTAGTITPSVLSGDFNWIPSFLLVGGNNSFTATPTGGTPPYQLVWDFADGSVNSSSHASSSGAFGLNVTKPSSSHTTTTSITCAPGSITVNVPSTCKVTVRDPSTTPTNPTGTVAFSSLGVGLFSPNPSCSLVGGPGNGNATCTVTYTPTAIGTGVHTILAAYPGDSGHVGASSGQFSLYVTSPTLSHATTTSVSCDPGSISLGNVTQCTATVTDSSKNPTALSGTVVFSSDSPGSFKAYLATCYLVPSTLVGIASCSMGYTPSSVGSGTHTISATYSGNADVQVTHIFDTAGTYAVTLSITDSTPATFVASHSIPVQGSPIVMSGWNVNWKIAAHHGVDVYNVSYNGLLTIRDAVVNGILVNYPVTPPGQTPALFYDDLGKDDLNSSIGGFTVTFSSDPVNPWFQIRAMYNFANVGYNYTQLWRFYTNGRWDAIFLDGHSGLAWNHIYQPQYRFDLVVGNKGSNLMSQFTPSGVWQNLVWEGNYTDNGFRDAAHNSTEWRIGDGKGYYYIVPSVAPFARDMPLIAPKIYLVRDHPGELLPDGELPSAPPDPIMFANGELAYRQDIAFWYLPSWWDHWLQSAGPPVAPPTIESISFYPSGV